MKKRRRYREKPKTKPGLNEVYKPGRVHDFFKGYGTKCKDGSILWDTWRPLTKKQIAKYEANAKKLNHQRRLENIKAGKHPDDIILKLPLLFNRTMPVLNLDDIINVQPMSYPTPIKFEHSLKS